MQLTVIMENDVASFEVASDMKLQDFLALCTAIPFNNLRLINNGHQIIPTDDLLKKELNELNIQNGDAIQILPISAASTSFLVEAPYRAEANEIFIKCANPKNLEFLRKEAPALAAAYDRNDPEAFYTAYRQFKAEKEREKRLMLDETCVEGQRLIVELIRRQTIDDMHELAMEHRQEDLVPVHMLYIRMQINNHPVIAFVDTGAQVSLLAESTAKRCGLNFVDSRVQAKASGIGGIQKMLGRIYQCQLQVGKYIFSCPFDVMSDKDCQGQSVILGLNVLLQHQCTIDLNLKRRVLRFIDGTETPFLNEVEYEREKEAIENCNIMIFLFFFYFLAASQQNGP